MGDIGAVEAGDRVTDRAVEADTLGAIGMTVELPTRRRRSRMVAKQEARLAGSRAAAKLAAMGHYKSNCPYARAVPEQTLLLAKHLALDLNFVHAAGGCVHAFPIRQPQLRGVTPAGQCVSAFRHYNVGVANSGRAAEEERSTAQFTTTSTTVAPLRSSLAACYCLKRAVDRDHDTLVASE